MLNFGKIAVVTISINRIVFTIYFELEASLGKAFLQLHRVVILRSTPLFFIIRVLMLLDIANIIVSQIHDIPDDIANQELFGGIFLLEMVKKCLQIQFSVLH